MLQFLSRTQSQFEETRPLSEGEYTFQFHFVGEIFPPYKRTHGPEEDPFDTVMCAVGAASQISFCLLKTLDFYTKHHLNLNRNFI